MDDIKRKYEQELERKSLENSKKILKEIISYYGLLNVEKYLNEIIYTYSTSFIGDDTKRGSQHNPELDHLHLLNFLRDTLLQKDKD